MDLMRDKFRTLLSLSGVSVGVFTIVLILTFVDSMEDTVNDGFRSFGQEVVFVEQQPLEPDLNEDGVFKWWKYIGRPPVRYSEYQFIKENAPSSAHVSFYAKTEEVVGICGDWRLVTNLPLEEGRGFSDEELSRDSHVALAGADIAVPENGLLKVGGDAFRVIGRFSRSGSNMVNIIDIDNACVIPYGAFSSLFGNCQSKSAIVTDLTDREVSLLMRAVRHLRPSDESDFAVNRLSYIIDEVSYVFNLVAKAGWIMGFFSLLVGGFGIANIMFVAVQERKSEIGLKKALGARRSTIMLEFLKEASFLSIAGGAVGILSVSLIAVLLPSEIITLEVSAKNILTGMGAAAVLGISSGLWPAFRASSLMPAESLLN